MGLRRPDERQILLLDDHYRFPAIDDLDAVSGSMPCRCRPCRWRWHGAHIRDITDDSREGDELRIHHRVREFSTNSAQRKSSKRLFSCSLDASKPGTVSFCTIQPNPPRAVDGAVLKRVMARGLRSDFSSSVATTLPSSVMGAGLVVGHRISEQFQRQTEAANLLGREKVLPLVPASYRQGALSLCAYHPPRHCVCEEAGP